MWVSTHLLTGMASGAASPGGLPVAAPAAVAGHLLLDLVPHWDYTRQPRRFLWATLDVTASAVVLLLGWLVFRLPLQVLVCGMLSAAPDLDIVTHALTGLKRWFPSHWRGFPHGHARRLPGIAAQVALWAVSIALLVWLPS
jgi:hypothetical protein